MAARSILLASWWRLYCCARSSGSKNSRMSTGFPWLVPLLRRVARLLGQREGLQRALVGQVVVSVAVPVPDVVTTDLHQCEEPVEDLVEHLLVAAVLDQGDAERGPELLAVAQHPRLPGTRHRVECLRDRDPHPRLRRRRTNRCNAFSKTLPPAVRCAEVDRAMPARPQRTARGKTGKQQIRARPISNADNPRGIAPPARHAEPVRPLPSPGGCDTLTTHWSRGLTKACSSAPDPGRACAEHRRHRGRNRPLLSCSPDIRAGGCGRRP